MALQDPESIKAAQLLLAAQIQSARVTLGCAPLPDGDALALAVALCTTAPAERLARIARMAADG